MSKNALPITVITGGWLSFNFLPDRTRNGNCTSVQPNTILRRSHHSAFAGIFSHNDARLIAARILKRDVKVAVLFRP
jgi:hypothetical protein